MLGDSFSILSIGDPDDDELLALLCGVIAFDTPAVHDLLAVLPPVVRVDSARHPVMVSLLPLLAEELGDPRPGGDAVATRLADVLVVETVRAWLAYEPDAAGGWLAALRDPRLGPAMAAVHRDPGHGWTLGRLARIAAMSRSSFAARFTASSACAHDVRGRRAHAPGSGHARRRIAGGCCRLGQRLRIRGRVQPRLRPGHRADTRPGSPLELKRPCRR